MQSHIELTASSYMVKYCAFLLILGSPSSYMTLHPIPWFHPYIWGKFCFLFYRVHRVESGNGHFLAYIPSWWKNLPCLVRVGMHHWTPTPFHYIYHHLQNCGVLYAPCSWEGRYTPHISTNPSMYSVVVTEANADSWSSYERESSLGDG